MINLKNNAFIFSLIFLTGFSILFSCKKEDPFVNTPPTVENQQFSLNENTPNGVMVDTVKATDIDKNQKLKYSIISGNFDTAFRIDSLTGVIYVNNSLALDYEKVTVFELGIKVKDDYQNSLSAGAKITIAINNVIEIPIPQNGLVAYYPFNGNANDESGNSHNGTVFGASLTTDRHHKANSAYGFNGINNYINTFSTFDYQYRTISFWAYFNDVTTFQILITQDSNLLNYGLFLASITNGLFTLQGGGGGSPTVWYQTNTISTNRWYHFVMVRNESINQYYINGDLVGTASSNTSGSVLNANLNFIIGSDRTTTNRMFNGKIDDIAIYDRALSATEINSIYGVK